MRAFLTVILAFVTSACAHNTDVERSASVSEDERLFAFLEQVFEARVERSPVFQSTLGRDTNKGRWDSRTEQHYASALSDEKSFLAELRREFDTENLSEASRLNYRLFEYDTELRIEGERWRHHNYALTHRTGVHAFVPSFLINTHKINNTADAESYISRLSDVGRFFDETIGQLRIAAAEGVIPPALIYQAAIEASRNVIRGAPFDDSDEESVIRADFHGKVLALKLPADQQKDLFDRADAALTDVTKPAYERMINYLGLLESRATGDHGAWKLPDGDNYYAFQLRRQTTTRRSAQEIHDLGLAEVQRIHEEMRVIMREVGFEGSLQEFFEFTRTDPQFYYSNDASGRERYLNEATALIDDMRKQLDSLFTVKPKADLLVKRVEPFREKSAGKAFYGRPAADGSRPGIYYANLYQMDRMPIYQMRALAYHEGIPGHHMQIAIQQELESIPSFRRFGFVTAFSEGWGLYSEWLPLEIGAYKDPYANFGRLAMELWRACRLVVDSGIHSLEWTVPQSIDYLLTNTPNAKGDVVSAVERYLVNPGQATAYKIGMLEIQALRARAEKELGSNFDIRRFHDAVLANGPVPLAILSELIDEHIEREHQ